MRQKGVVALGGGFKPRVCARGLPGDGSEGPAPFPGHFLAPRQLLLAHKRGISGRIFSCRGSYMVPALQAMIVGARAQSGDAWDAGAGRSPVLSRSL